MMSAFDVIISARNEAPTIGEVVAAARSAKGVGRVIVVDDHSSDGTPDVAAAAGAEVVESEGSASKARAMATGVRHASAPVLVFFDADIIGVKPAHFELLAARVLDGSFSMCCGLVDRGSIRNTIFLRLPPITGLRALRREVFEAIPAEKLNGFQIEIMINEVLARNRLPTAIRVLTGTSHRTKVDKLGRLEGIRAHLAMTAELLHCFTFVPLWTYGSYLKRLTVLS